jgi:hypothetical protein
MKTKFGNTDPVPAFSIGAISIINEISEIPPAMLPTTLASMEPVPPGRGNPISASSVSQLSPHLPRYGICQVSFSPVIYCVIYNYQFEASL